MGVRKSYQNYIRNTNKNNCIDTIAKDIFVSINAFC